jgi:hypothetical protein
MNKPKRHVGEVEVGKAENANLFGKLYAVGLLMYLNLMVIIRLVDIYV